jgi:hypothetical protein
VKKIRKDEEKGDKEGAMEVCKLRYGERSA